MKVAQKYLFSGAAAVALFLSGCAGDYWVSAPYEGPGYGAYYGFHHFYGRNFETRHFAVGHGGSGYHGGGHPRGPVGHSSGHGGHR
jgi:hypothetical protein